MSSTKRSALSESWPTQGLEDVPHCPFCDSSARVLAHKDVEDWSFQAAAGTWTYWDCKSCGSLYLDPRPTEKTIGNAYKFYYTHSKVAPSFLSLFKNRVRNECISLWLETNLMPRLHLPVKMSFLLSPLKRMLIIPFGLKEIIDLPKGRLLDIGCGSGDMLKTAKSLGWNVTGLEIDPNAVRNAQSQGLDVIQGDFNDANLIAGLFDCIICSHVLEHVHQPNQLLNFLVKKLAPNGTLLLSLPNSKSHLRELFGENWRGLEAPRHLAIPALNQIKNALISRGFSEITQNDVFFATYLESIRIKNRKTKTTAFDFLYYKIKLFFQYTTNDASSDFIQIVARKTREDQKQL